MMVSNRNLLFHGVYFPGMRSFQGGYHLKLRRFDLKKTFWQLQWFQVTNIIQTSPRTHPWDWYICQHLVDVRIFAYMKTHKHQPSNKPMLANIPWNSYGMMRRIINHQRLDLQNQPLDPPIHVGNNIYPFFHGNPSWVMVTLHKALRLISERTKPWHWKRPNKNPRIYSERNL